MKEVKFKVFLEANKVKKTDLPRPLVEKIGIFWKLHKLLDSIQDSDRDDLLEQLEQLDYEILGEIEEEYEDQLENNDRLEEILKSPLVKKSIKDKAKSKIRTDESILQELVTMGRMKNIRRSVLKSLGVKSKIEHDTVIGKYQLKRMSFFFHVYGIVPLKKGA
ncbi:hypothetical protein HN014_04355 [Aquimarina sp. TRL1]|uniref:hypothetical protein n=1 Tax=Aquimarina sp. (strain TRL1) TaxID=2736252 RepID=UPI0015889340|nr:hypothetical protein [Aquimarina sp. TRL1]QKX04170.1 hypothetical protein HN014_04355 [Aquimarina sp. TRL1]